MLPLAETEMNCPDCGTVLHALAKQCGCGWKANRKVAGPDYDRIRRERETSVATYNRPYHGPRACQARDCPITTRALPGKDFCQQHDLEFVRDPDSVRRAGLPSNIRKMLRHLET